MSSTPPDGFTPTGTIATTADRRRVVFATVVGTTVEWYDVFIYASAAGLVFGLRGSIERVTNKVFLLSPANVDVGAEARAQIAQDGFFNQS